MDARRHKNSRQRGATMLETTIAICFLFFLFFAMLQIYQWCLDKLFCQYASYYGAKGMTLGYTPEIVRRSVRVAAIPISGENIGTGYGDEVNAARNYLVNGDASGVDYRCWHPQKSGEPELHLSGVYGSDYLTATVSLRHAPLLTEELSTVLGVLDNPIPQATTYGYDHSKLFLEDE